MNSMNLIRNMNNETPREGSGRADPQKPPKDHLVAGARFRAIREEI